MRSASAPSWSPWSRSFRSERRHLRPFGGLAATDALELGADALDRLALHVDAQGPIVEPVSRGRALRLVPDDAHRDPVVDPEIARQRRPERSQAVRDERLLPVVRRDAGRLAVRP